MNDFLASGGGIYTKKKRHFSLSRYPAGIWGRKTPVAAELAERKNAVS